MPKTGLNMTVNLALPSETILSANLFKSELITDQESRWSQGRRFGAVRRSFELQKVMTVL
jgi:hypothetical protein